MWGAEGGDALRSLLQRRTLQGSHAGSQCTQPALDCASVHRVLSQQGVTQLTNLGAVCRAPGCGCVKQGKHSYTVAI